MNGYEEVCEVISISLIALTYTFLLISSIRRYLTHKRVRAFNRMNDLIEKIGSNNEISDEWKGAFLIVSAAVLEKNGAKKFIKLCKTIYKRNLKEKKNITKEKISSLKRQQERIRLENEFIFSAISLSYSIVGYPWRSKRLINKLKNSLTIRLKQQNEQTVYRLKPSKDFLKCFSNYPVAA